ncbi:MAG: integrase arm-type DNA-binding domain-containing protein [Rhizobiaceae bacterium]|nr:integrase arm-type DNA-binding domain-containing protein [Rhizobiaceae bacterium]|tara:strand:+ start:216 stop:1385 length:1170 start_codon:yes stop_codon:yes gene_type:complete
MAGLHKLTAIAVKSAGPGKHNDGHGLWLVKRVDNRGQWVLRLAIFGRRREMGLGSLADVSLKQARDSAAHWRGIAKSGKDPIQERTRLSLEARYSDTSLRTIAIEAFEARKAELKGDGKAGRWFSPLELHLLPKLGDTPVGLIHQNIIKDVLAPIWHVKADVAQKALNRLSIVLRYAAAKGIDVDLQATAKAKELLGRSRHKIQHIPSIPWMEIPDFYVSLQELTVTHLALRMLILTGARSLPIRMMRVEHIADDTWTIPGELMKGPKGKTEDFRIPLSVEAVRVINLTLPLSRNGLLFAAARGGTLSDATMSRLMERRGLDARPHGFRSSLRMWLAEATDATHEVAEMTLSHSFGNSVTRAYQRSDFLDQRRELLERWGRFVANSTTA